MPEATRPNILLIMTDQQRADFCAAEEFPLDTMPFVDGLGQRGARFARAYTPNPTCAPARCSMLTGRFPKATRVRENHLTSQAFRTPDLLDVLRDAGYSVNLAGKNHTYREGADFDFAALYGHVGGGRRERRGQERPLRRSAPAPGGRVDDAEGATDVKTLQEEAFDRWLKELDHGVSAVPAPFPLECQLPYRIVRDAIQCIEERDRDRPFFLWLSFPEPHNPYQAPEPYFSLFPEADVPAPAASAAEGASKGPKWRWMQRLIEEKRPGYRDEWRRYRANYCGMLRLLDDQVRRFVEYLEAQGLRDDTLLIFCSDHGDYAGDYGLQRKGVGMPECLVRVPLIFHGPGVAAQPAPRREFVSLVDLLPTICDRLGVPIPYGVQGRSLWPLLSGLPVESETFRSIYAELGFGGEHYGEADRPPLHFPYEGPTFDELNSVTQSGKLKMLRMDRWKLLFDHEGHGELYDLADDPLELRDRWHDPDCGETRCALLQELLRWNIRTEDDLPLGKYIPDRAA